MANASRKKTKRRKEVIFMSEPKNESKMLHTAIEDLLVAGDELPEETLRLVVGGDGPDGGSGTNVCSPCHEYQN
jgi:hypothetical protein